jgi:hypothetical protein
MTELDQTDDQGVIDPGPFRRFRIVGTWTVLAVGLATILLRVIFGR